MKTVVSLRVLHLERELNNLCEILYLVNRNSISKINVLGLLQVVLDLLLQQLLLQLDLVLVLQKHQLTLVFHLEFNPQLLLLVVLHLVTSTTTSGFAFDMTPVTTITSTFIFGPATTTFNTGFSSGPLLQTTTASTGFETGVPPNTIVSTSSGFSFGSSTLQSGSGLSFGTGIYWNWFFI
ncbi:hypothetical protein NPIL_557761 [Nephila pilipes]|uniref:Uncharacterized protein n=1 Tax=Nephila pilipes TaxID=299642 RepID=A0A8X6TWV9_NEPPI|nr:hypothetical protein NPIL_557761 [Nephila pilipes]